MYKHKKMRFCFNFCSTNFKKIKKLYKSLQCQQIASSACSTHPRLVRTLQTRISHIHLFLLSEYGFLVAAERNVSGRHFSWLSFSKQAPGNPESAFPFQVPLLDGFPLVVKLLAATDAKFHLYESILQVNLDRHQGEAFLLHLLPEFSDLFLVD